MGEEGEQVVEQIRRNGGKALGMAVDVCERTEVDAAVGTVVDQFGRLDIVVNNAGGLVDRQDVRSMADDHWAAVINLNLTSAFYCCRAAIPYISDGGRIINIASLAGLSGGGPGSTAYAAAKAGMFGLTRGLARELAPRRITVNAVAPGMILETPFHETFTPPRSQRAAIEALPLGRAGTPLDVASAVAWLSTRGGEWITGEVVNVNGGQQFV